MDIGEGLSRAEREIVIRKSDDEELLDVWTSSPLWARRLAKLAKAWGVEGEASQGGISYKLPIKAISLRKPRILTDEQRARLTSRARKNFSVSPDNNRVPRSKTA